MSRMELSFGKEDAESHCHPLLHAILIISTVYMYIVIYVYLYVRVASN